jgi:hypothetical protein
MPAQAANSEKDVDEEFSDVTFRRGENWNEENIRTLTRWTHVCAIKCEIAQESTIYYRDLMRRNTVFTLILSSFAGIASLSQFNIDAQTNEILSNLLKGFFSVASILVALNSGFLKIYEVQERLEASIRLQNAWTQFGSRISSEMQLPVTLRKDALYMIIKMKETYHELIKDQVQISKHILQKVALRNGISPQALTITDLFEQSVQSELQRLDNENGRNDYAVVPAAEHFVPQRVPSRTFSILENKKDREMRNLTRQTVVQRTMISNALMNPSSSYGKSSSGSVSGSSSSYGQSASSTVGSPSGDSVRPTSEVFWKYNNVINNLKKVAPAYKSAVASGDSGRDLTKPVSSVEHTNKNPFYEYTPSVESIQENKTYNHQLVSYTPNNSHTSDNESDSKGSHGSDSKGSHGSDESKRSKRSSISSSDSDNASVISNITNVDKHDEIV